MIEPDPDWYGSYARRSAIADYLELLALAGKSLTVEDLADRIRDNRWTSSLGERIGVPTPPDEEEDATLGVEIDRALERARGRHLRGGEVHREKQTGSRAYGEA